MIDDDKLLDGQGLLQDGREQDHEEHLQRGPRPCKIHFAALYATIVVLTCSLIWALSVRKIHDPTLDIYCKLLSCSAFRQNNLLILSMQLLQTMLLSTKTLCSIMEFKSGHRTRNCHLMTL